VSTPPGLNAYPLCVYFLSEYLSKRNDSSNFPPDQIPGVFQRHEILFASALQALGMTKEGLKGRSEFNFDSGDAQNLEGGVAILRVVEALRLKGFSKISLVKPGKGKGGADIVCEKNCEKVCVEVKTITKQSSGRRGSDFADQLYQKILENISKASRQLKETAESLQCTITAYFCVVNWFDQSIYFQESDYQHIVDRLEKDQDQYSLQGIDVVWFVTKMGQQFAFLNERGKLIDRDPSTT
jgi:hypothetical protein